MTRSRISLAKEDRIWTLRVQGYDYDSIARIVNIRTRSLTPVIRRVRRRPTGSDLPRAGRGHSFLSDQQVDTIRQRIAVGEKQHEVAKDFGISASAVNAIWRNRTYVEPEYPNGYRFDFSNRLMGERN
jgi:transcriptional regulator